MEGPGPCTSQQSIVGPQQTAPQQKLPSAGHTMFGSHGGWVQLVPLQKGFTSWQALLQPPQWLMSFVTLTQPPSQQVSPPC